MDIHMPFYLAGRVLLGGFFIISGLRHFQHLPMMAGFTGSKGVPQPKQHPAPMPAKGGAPLTDEQVKQVSAYVYSISR